MQEYVLPFVFPIGYVCGESKRASVGSILCMASDVLHVWRFNPSQITNVQEVGGTVTAFLPVWWWWWRWWWQMQRPEGEVTWHSNHLMDSCFPCEANGEMRKVLCNQPDFAAQKCTLCLFPAGSMQGRKWVTELFPWPAAVHWAAFNMIHKISVLTSANSDFIT